jgi:photosystem II stability/assembly factor-like uncharacterized protein
VSQTASLWHAVGPLPTDSETTATAPKNLERIVPGAKHSIWVTSGGRICWVTEDSGRTWKTVETVSRGAEVGGLLFLDDRTAWITGAVGNKAFLASTADGGKEWNFKHSASESASSSLSDVSFFGKRVGIAVGGGEFAAGSRSLIAVTHDGGNNWKDTLLPTDDPQPVLKRVAFQSKSIVWATGGKSVYSSNDGGAKWVLRHREADAIDLEGLAVVEGAGVFVTGGWGLALRSRDFGATWEKLKVPAAVSKQYLSSVAFADASHGWICGDHGLMISTKDGGDTWQEEFTARSELLRFVGVFGDQVLSAGDSLTLIRRPL